MDYFAYATRNALRFPSTRGDLTTEDLWDLPLKHASKFDLDSIAKTLNRQIKDEDDESFVTTTRKNPALHTKFEIVKMIITVKLEEAEAAQKAKANADRKKVLLAALADKQAAATAALTEEQIKAELATL